MQDSSTAYGIKQTLEEIPKEAIHGLNPRQNLVLPGRLDFNVVTAIIQFQPEAC